MNKCNSYIESMYLHPKVNELLGRIKPTELQEDLRQELAIVLLDYNCTKLIKIHKEGNLLGFTLRILWTIGTGKRNDFYRKYKKNNLIEFTDILVLNKYDSNFDLINEDLRDLSDYAIDKLNNKLTMNANEAHESILFKKYVEMKSCTKVAKHFNIPKKHVFLVVKKTKEELKKTINDNL